MSGPLLDIIFDSTSMMRGLLGVIRNGVESGEALNTPPGYEDLRHRLRLAIAGEPLPDSDGPTALDPSKRLGEALIETGFANADEVEAALERQKESGKRLGEELIASGAGQCQGSRANLARAKHGPARQQDSRNGQNRHRTRR